MLLLSQFRYFTFARQGLILGAFDYIVKPIEENVLSELLNKVEEFREKNAGKDYHTAKVKILVQ